MSNELVYTDHTLTGLTTYYVVLQQGATIVKASDGSSLALSSANWQAAAIALSDTGHAGHYLASVPANTGAGRYRWRVYQASGTPSSTAAIGDEVISGEDVLDWIGTAENGATGTPAVNVLYWLDNDAQVDGDGRPVVNVGAVDDNAANTGPLKTINDNVLAGGTGLSTEQADTLTAIYNSTGQITQGNIIVTSGTRNGVLPIMQGHTYADGVALQVTQPDGTWPDLANYPNSGTNGLFLTLELTTPYLVHPLYLANTNLGRITISPGTATGTFAATNQAVAFRPGTVTATLVPTTQGYPTHPYKAQVWAVSGSNSKRLFDGMAPVPKDIRS